MYGTSAAEQLDFSFLDEPEFRAKYATGPQRNQIRFYVGGIKCGKCVRKLEDMPLSVTGLKNLRIEMGKNLAHAEVDPEVLTFSSLAREIANLGYKPIPLSTEMNDDQLQRAEDRTEMIRLAIAAACAGNIMTFSFANYFGTTGDFRTLFEWLSFALYLPVVTYVAWPFYIGAWNSLTKRRISIDLPMAVASLSGFLFSTYELLQGRSDVYFDSLSGFLFLILLSRAVQKRLQRTFLRPQELLESLQLGRVRRVHSNGWAWTPVEQLLPGDRILVCAPETLPAEAELISANAYFSMAWLSGESKPRTFLRGSVIPAGARLVNSEAVLLARTPLGETSFGQILQEVRSFSLSKNRIVSQADRWAQWLLLTVFAVAAVFLVIGYPVMGHEAARRALSLIILACPCAMAFGTPLAFAAALKKSQKSGLIIRNANVFEKATKVKTIFFDKTGTLTDTELVLREEPLSVPLVYKKIVLALENESMHPIAFAFRKAFAGSDTLPPVDGRREIYGVGVSGFIYGKFYELKKNANEVATTGCVLFEDEQPIYSFSFTAELKPDCALVLSKLRSAGYQLKLLSGDKKESVEAFGAQLGFEPQNIHSETSPARKAEIVSQTPNAMMVGDGINDSLALMRASVSVAATGGMEAALKSSDVYLAESSLKGIAHLLDLSKMSLQLIRQNLLISVLYNTTGGVLALMGFVNPFVAAILMPISSCFILLSTWQMSKRA